MFKSENEGRVCEVQRAPRAFTQYVFDNFDHDTSTLDGHGTVHVLGGQRIVTLVDPTAEVKVDCIPRRALPSSASQIAQDLNYAMDIVWLKGPVLNGLKSVLVQPMTSTSLSWDPSGPSLPPFIRDALTVDSLWMAGRRFVELAATDPNAINTALRYAMKDADDRGQDDCFVTFDQPLYMKAMKLVTADPALSGVQVRLGGFHLTMSYLGSIAHIMSGSGLEDVWAQVYAFNSIKHMVTGKAYSRAVRAHFLVQEAIGSMLLDRVTADATRRGDIRELYGDFLERADVTAEEVANTPVARRLGKDLIEAGEQAASDSATGKLWWQYFKLVALLRFHIRAERTGDWEMHKESVKAMLPIFHAAGHLPYARAAHLYVQQMEELTGGCSQAANDGNFTVRRSSDFWAGMWTDLVIEQCLMRLLKCRGGVTRGRGLTKSSVTQFILTRHALVDLSAAIEEYSGAKASVLKLRVTNDCAERSVALVEEYNKILTADEEQKQFLILDVKEHRKRYPNVNKTTLGIKNYFYSWHPNTGTSEQHVELRVGRQERDCRDLKKFCNWLKKYNPFIDWGRDNQRVVCLHTGQLGAAQVNCNEAVAVGTALMEKMYGKDFEQSLQLKGRVIPLSKVPLSTGAPPHKAKDAPDQKSQFYFNKMVTLDLTQDDLKRFFTCELSDMPPALFDDGLMRSNNKAKLTRKFRPDGEDADDSLFEEPHDDATPGPSLPTKTVVDGGHLLHAVAWPRSERGKEHTYGDVCDRYVNYIKRYQQPTVVFDGYEESWSTKWEVQQRRAARKKVCPKFSVTEEEEISPAYSREDFLSSAFNKTGITSLLTEKLQGAGAEVLQARADADIMIAETAIRLDQPGEHVTVIARDTDVLAILAARARDETGITVTKPGSASKADEVFSVQAIRVHLAKQGLLHLLLFGHAMSGCDTTSNIHTRGKLAVWNALLKDATKGGTLRQEVAVFNQPAATREVIAAAGEKLILALYPDERCACLDDLRYVLYIKTCETKTKVDLSTLPPTCAAAAQHCFRVYLQVQQWMGNDLDPTAWGWRAADGTLVPIPTTLPPAPSELLSRLSCNCSASGCGPRCPCRLRGAYCDSFCRKCKGETCKNVVEGGEDDEIAWGRLLD
ncbi:Fat-like cadherin-related tumor suppressor-like protein [Frankliniella fusca]|uniref:Fat-like cadherin-related tumor suppressor-like protein n=1 Tax=Frankliniella fusca TaxID=407009 RepID=A0AAE1LRI8_9NEOP|nr:Fat-like cadherin-related tumor suppressor-like protein [Frankliniella fusca]